MMQSSRRSGRKVLVAVIVVILMVFSAFRCYYFFAHKGEDLMPSLVKRILWPPEETQETANTELPMKLTVNPDYDGRDEDKEYIYSNSADEEAVVRIFQTVTYEYYDNKGSAIRTVETQSYNASGEKLSRSYRRESCKMADTSIDQQEIEIMYRYDTDTIRRDYTIVSYIGTGSVRTIVDSMSESSEQNRT